jgi:hypothetical protein
MIFWLITQASIKHGVDPNFAKAVAIVESGIPGKCEIRIGRLGKSRYYGPMGLDKDFLSRWPIDDPITNIEIGVRALRGRDKRAVLKRYHGAPPADYVRAVMSKYREYGR